MYIQSVYISLLIFKSSFEGFFLSTKCYPKKLYVMDPDLQRFVDAGLEYGAAMGVFAVAAVGAVQQPLLPPHPHLGLPHGNLYCF